MASPALSKATACRRCAWAGRPSAFGRRPAGRRRPFAPATAAVRAAAIVGVDLGTSNSAVSAALPVPRMLAAAPSLVAVAQDGRILVGQEVLEPPAGYSVASYSTSAGAAGAQGQEGKAGLVVLPCDTFHSFKRLMGRRLSEVAEEAARLGYAVGEGDRGEALVYSPALDDMLSPEELSTHVLQHLRQLAEAALDGEEVGGAVVTVPAHFNQAQQRATLSAAQQAGFREVQLLQEPVAAALAYGINGGVDGDTVLVFDVGGGTFDVSLLQAFEGILEVLGTAGDAELGGNDFDALLADWLLAECAARGDRSGSTLSAADSSRSDASNGAAAATAQPASTLQQREWARRAAEAAKIALSHSEEAEVSLPDGGKLVLTRRQFEELTAPLFQRLANVLETLGEALFVEWAVRPSLAVPGAQQQEDEPSGNDSAATGSSADSSSGNDSSGNGSVQSSGDKWAPPPRRITEVALVGQLTRLPSMRQFVRRITGVEPRMTVDPAEAVALGAAVHAGVLLGEVSGVELMDGSYSQDLHDRATGFSGWRP